MMRPKVGYILTDPKASKRSPIEPCGSADKNHDPLIHIYLHSLCPAPGSWRIFLKLREGARNAAIDALEFVDLGDGAR
jgi:hypothetical protein